MNIIKSTFLTASLVLPLMVCAQGKQMKMTTPIPESVSTPDKVETSEGTMNFFDGVPTKETVELSYDFLDKMNAVKVFQAMLPSMSVNELREGQRSVGAVNSNQICIFDNLMDSKSLFLTGNTSTMYALGFLDLKKDGPTVVELPKGMLGVFNDMAFLFMENLGAAGPDRGEGGKYLVLPPGYDGNVPEGYFVVRSNTYGVWNFMRGYLTNGVEAAAKNIKDNLKVYPLSKMNSQPQMEFINVTGKEMNTIVPADYSFYTKLHQLVQEEPVDFIDGETRGVMRSIGIEKGKPFNPDARMKAILDDAIKIGEAIARTVTYYPREKGQFAWEDVESGWVVPFAEHDSSWKTKDGTRKIEMQMYYHYNCIVVTPAMAKAPGPGKGSEYVFKSFDTDEKILLGDQNYKMTLPPDPPVADFWAITLYDTQTRSQLQTDQQFPTVDTYSKGLVKNKDGSITLYFGKDAPKDKKLHNNWLQTVPGKSFFVCLRMYGPTEPWIEGKWRPGEITKIN